MQSACAISYCHLWLAWLHHIFSLYLINGSVFKKKVIEHKTCVLGISTTFIRNISNYKNNLARYLHKCGNVFMQSTRYSCHRLSKKVQVSNFVKICPVEIELFHAESVAFRNFANASKYEEWEPHLFCSSHIQRASKYSDPVAETSSCFWNTRQKDKLQIHINSKYNASQNILKHVTCLAWNQKSCVRSWAIGSVFLQISKDPSALIFRVKHSSWAACPWRRPNNSFNIQKQFSQRLSFLSKTIYFSSNATVNNFIIETWGFTVVNTEYCYIIM